MPIYRLFQNGAFQPEHVQAMGSAFEDVLKALKLVDRTDPLTDTIAKKIIELGQRGEHDPARLRDQTLAELTR